MKLKGLIIAHLLLITGLINAQTDFRSGYIIVNQEDTLSGMIDYRGDVLMGEKCRFKFNETEEIIIYNPNDIVGFKFNDGKYFVSKEIDGKRLFLEFLIKARVSVFYIRDDKGNHYYLDKEDIGLTEMPYEEDQIVKNNQAYFNTTTKHIGVLNYYMQDAPDFQSKIFSMGEPNHVNLIKLAKDYNFKICKEDNCIIYEKILPIFKLSLEPFIRFAKYNSEYSYYGTIHEYGLNLYLWMPHSSEKLSFKTGLIYVKVNNGHFYKMPLQFQYLYPSGRFRPKANIGVDIFLGNDLGPYDNINGYLPQAGIGFIYKIYKKVYFSTNLSIEYTPLLLIKPEPNNQPRHSSPDQPPSMYIDTYTHFDVLSHAFSFGFYIDL
jgi:hypothetical protein